MRKFLAAITAAFLLTVPLSAHAQSYTSTAPDNNDDAQVRGRIINFDGDYTLQVRDEQGAIDNVQLHQGTIINPTGLTLEPGMIISVLGYNAGPFFAANEVDTPYVYNGNVAYYNGQAWNSYGPSIGLDFYFGNTGWWHGEALGGTYQYNGGARAYDGVRVNAMYRGGTFQGRNYVAPRESGGYYGRGSNNAAHPSDPHVQH